jgi:hypothetical protein
LRLLNEANTHAQLPVSHVQITQNINLTMNLLKDRLALSRIFLQLLLLVDGAGRTHHGEMSKACEGETELFGIVVQIQSNLMCRQCSGSALPYNVLSNAGGKRETRMKIKKYQFMLGAIFQTFIFLSRLFHSAELSRWRRNVSSTRHNSEQSGERE